MIQLQPHADPQLCKHQDIHNHKHSTPISGRKKTKTEKAAKKLKGKHNPKNQKAISYNIIRHTHAKTKQNCVGIPHETQKKKKKETQQNTITKILVAKFYKTRKPRGTYKKITWKACSSKRPGEV